MGKFIVAENSSLGLDFHKLLMEKYHGNPVTEIALFQLVTVFAKAFDVAIALHCEQNGDVHINHPYDW